MVARYRVEDAEALNRRLERRIRKIRKRTPLWKGEERPWQCAPNLHRDDDFAPLVSAVRDAVDGVIAHMRYDLDRWDFTGMWANFLMDGDFHPPHNHSNNLLSGVYYVSAPSPGATGIRLMHPNPAAHVLSPRLTAFTEANSASWNFPAEPGTGLIFPSWLEHYVPQVRGGDRISVAWNMMAHGELSTPDSLEWAAV